jgi:hypothetical protein
MSRRRVNPFYAIVLLAGVAFTLTACAYGWMTYLSTRRPTSATSAAASQSSLLPILREHGTQLMAGELVVLAIATLAAFATDRRSMNS